MGVALAALIAAYHESGEPGHLRATLPLAGRTVLERQARLAAGAGADPVIVFVERLPAALTAAIERLRRDRVPIRIVRTVEEAAEAVDPFDRLLLVADGAVLPASQHARLADCEGAAVLTVPDGSHGELYERIDAGSRWAGLAAIDGALLRETAGMLRDWDLQSTLLRRTLQAGARHIAAEGAVAILDREEDLDLLERRIVAGADEARGGWMDRLLAPDRALRHRRPDGEPGFAAPDRLCRRLADRPRRRLLLRPLVLDRPRQIADRDAARRHRPPPRAPQDAGRRPPELVGLSHSAVRRRRHGHPRLWPRARPWLGHGAARLRHLCLSRRARASRPRGGRSAAPCSSPSARA